MKKIIISILFLIGGYFIYEEAMFMEEKDFLEDEAAIIYYDATMFSKVNNPVVIERMMRNTSKEYKDAVKSASRDDYSVFTDRNYLYVTTEKVYTERKCRYLEEKINDYLYEYDYYDLINISCEKKRKSSSFGNNRQIKIELPYISQPFGTMKSSINNVKDVVEKMIYEGYVHKECQHDFCDFQGIRKIQERSLIAHNYVTDKNHKEYIVFEIKYKNKIKDSSSLADFSIKYDYVNDIFIIKSDKEMKYLTINDVDLKLRTNVVKDPLFGTTKYISSFKTTKANDFMKEALNYFEGVIKINGVNYAIILYEYEDNDKVKRNKDFEEQVLSMKEDTKAINKILKDKSVFESKRKLEKLNKDIQREKNAL